MESLGTARGLALALPPQHVGLCQFCCEGDQLARCRRLPHKDLRRWFYHGALPVHV